ncbi:MAG: trypsin-like serine peptidase [Telluria sp.]
MNKAMLAGAPLLGLSLLAAAPSHAEDHLLIVNNNADAKAAAAYWTPERFRAAQPLPMPHVAPGTTTREEPSAAPEEKSLSSEPKAPTAQLRNTVRKLFTPDASAERSSEVVTPEAVGTFGAHYTSTRVFPQFTGTAAPFSADRAYPYITVGKLFFSIDGAPYVCSASVIQHRIVATAGHCVHSGTRAGFHSNWVFVPAFRDGTAPLLAWNWRAAIVTGTWASGGGTVPNAADYAMIEFGDQSIGRQTFALGDVTGWLGWQTLSLSANHTSKLGYPCNLDRCQKMQDVTSGAFRNTSPNNVEYGSDALGGSSGGPWVQNFQVLPTGGGTGMNTGSNRVVGVTSYIYVPSDPKVQGASILDNRWVSIFNTLCGRVAGNCL